MITEVLVAQVLLVAGLVAVVAAYWYAHAESARLEREAEALWQEFGGWLGALKADASNVIADDASNVAKDLKRVEAGWSQPAKMSPMPDTVPGSLSPPLNGLAGPHEQAADPPAERGTAVVVDNTQSPVQTVDDLRARLAP